MLAMDYCWSFFLKAKSETADIMIKFVKKLKDTANIMVKNIQCDNASENKAFQNHLEQEWISLHFE